MSWDEKDWAFTWITGKRYRLNLLFRNFTIAGDLEAEICHTIYEYGRNVEAFRIMDEQEMRKVARDYGIMIEHQFLGPPSECCFDYRDNDCALSNVDLSNPSPFRVSDDYKRLNFYSCKYVQPNRFREMRKYFEEDLEILETFLQKSKGQYFTDGFIESVEKKKIEFAEKLIKHLKQDIQMLRNLKGDFPKACFNSIRGKGYRLNLLFRKLVFKDEIKHSEGEIVFYAPHICFDKLTMLKEIAKMYGVCIKLDHLVYDYRHSCCQPETFDLNTLSPLDSINMGSFVSSLSSFDCNFAL